MRHTTPALLAALALACQGSPGPGPDDVTGTRLVTWWQDDGTTLVLPDLPDGTTIAALVVEGSGWRRVEGSITAEGHFTVPGVGPGAAYLELRRPGAAVQYYELAARHMDLGYEAVGRPNVVSATQPTELDLALTGLEPWAPGHELAIYVPGARQVHFRGDTAAAAGATSVSLALSLQGRPLPAAGDRAFLVQSAARTTGGGTPYTVAVRLADLALPEVADGQVASAGAALRSGPASGSTALTVQAADYAALAPAAEGLDVGTTAVRVMVFASPHFPGAFPPVTLLRTGSGGVAGPSLDLGTLTWPRLLPAWFFETRYVEASWTVRPSGLTAYFVVSAVRQEPVEGAPATVGPGLGPVRSPRIAGRDALLAQTGVGLTPTLAWTAPALGTATRYGVSLYDTTGGSLGFRASVGTSATSFSFPAGVLEAGHTYLAILTASREPAADPAAPERETATQERAVAFTATFAP